MIVKQLIVLLKKANGFWKAKVRRNQLWNRLRSYRENMKQMDVDVSVVRRRKAMETRRICYKIRLTTGEIRRSPT